jgi:hypothetical protein
MAAGQGSESSRDAANKFATFESSFPFSTINWDDLTGISEDAVAVLESMPFSTIDSDDFTLVFGLIVHPDFCCESGYLNYTDFVVKRCPFDRAPDGQDSIKGGSEKA